MPKRKNIINKSLLIAFALFSSANSSAERIKVPKMNVMPFTATQNMSYGTIKKFHDAYSRQLESGATYLSLALGYTPNIQLSNAPISKSKLFNETASLYDRALAISALVNQTIDEGEKRNRSVNLSLSDIQVGAGNYQCAATPYFKRIYAGEIHRVNFTCSERELNTYLIFAYSLDGTIRSHDGQLLARVDSNTEYFRSELSNLSHNRQFPLSLRITVKP